MGLQRPFEQFIYLSILNIYRFWRKMLTLEVYSIAMFSMTSLIKRRVNITQSTIYLSIYTKRKILSDPWYFLTISQSVDLTVPYSFWGPETKLFNTVFHLFNFDFVWYLSLFLFAYYNERKERNDVQKTFGVLENIKNVKYHFQFYDIDKVFMYYQGPMLCWDTPTMRKQIGKHLTRWLRHSLYLAIRPGGTKTTFGKLKKTSQINSLII